VYRLFLFPPRTLEALASKAGVTAKLMTTFVEHVCVMTYRSMYFQAGGNSVYPYDDLEEWIRDCPEYDEAQSHRVPVYTQPSFLLNQHISRACLAMDSTYLTMTPAAARLVRDQVLLLHWGVVTNDSTVFEQILASHYTHHNPEHVSTRQLQSLITSNQSKARKNVLIRAVTLVVIYHRDEEMWFDLDGGIHSLDVGAAAGAEQFFHVHIKERKDGAKITDVIDSQTVANLPFFKALYFLDQQNPVTVQRKRWPDLRPFGYSTGARKGEKRPPGNKITVQRGPIIHDAVTGDRYRKWTQVIHPQSIILPPHITIRETLATSATTVTSDPL
jgi:hypothetical protein